MKKKCLILLMIVLVLVSGTALAQRRPGGFGKPDKNKTQKEESSFKTEEERLEYLKEEARQDTLDKLRRAYEPKPKDYDQNTVCSFGPQFREVSPRMTDEWYMFTPIDLSREGKQTFDLIAGHMYVVGQVTVTVENGKFQVDYMYNNSGIEIGREYFNLFADYESISEKDLDNFHQNKRFSYGRAYSIANKLDGDTDVILFVCNTATFKKTSGVSGYFSTNPDRVEQREIMLDMIGKSSVAETK